MRNRFVCRRCEGFSAHSKHSFVIPGAKPRYAPDLPFRLEHLKLEIEVDPRAKLLKGSATQTLRVVTPGQTRIRFDQVGLKIARVAVGGEETQFSTQAGDLWVELPEFLREPVAGTSLDVKIEYEVHNPKRGLYFTGPDADYPSKPIQVWSQGQDEGNRWWIPLFDSPNQKATTEVAVTVPKGFTAVSNGALLSSKDEGDKSFFHYRLGMPQAAYLITLVVAEFSYWKDEGPRGLPVEYYVQPGREDDGKRAFGNTPRMIEAFERRTGVPYAYEKYSQVAVQDFIFGGMENTSATTQTDRTLHDERAHLDVSSDPLVSHELAHQWFGDLITCRDWSHGWLNEGFATFMERVWIESDTKTYGSEEAAFEEAKYYSYIDLKEYQEEDSKKYRRPIVCNTYVEPMDLFDTHLYQKGGLVLNLVRAQLGDDLFWKSINAYLVRHRGGSVETLDLIRAIEETTGRNLRKLFDQWVFGVGYPEYEIAYEWHGDTKLAELVIEQNQEALFDLDVRVELTFEGGKREVRTYRVSEARERVFISAESKPLAVRFDPDNTIPKSLKFPRPKEMLLYQLANDPDCMGRIEAARELVKIADGEVIPALTNALLKDSFWGVQAEVADVLSGVRDNAARDALIAGLKLKHPKTRKAAAQALGAFRDSRASTALETVAQGDASYLVESQALTAWAKSRALASTNPKSPEVDETEKALLQALTKESYHEVLRAAALDGLAGLPGIARGERPSALDALVVWTERGRPEDARLAAIHALGQVAKYASPDVKGRVLEVFTERVEEDGFRLRGKLIQALSDAGFPECERLLSRIEALDIDPRIRRAAYSTKMHLIENRTLPEALGQLKEQFSRYEEEYRKLRSQFEELKASKDQSRSI